MDHLLDHLRSGGKGPFSGKLVHYYYRVEFQQKGSPQLHLLLWIKNAKTVELALGFNLINTELPRRIQLFTT
jgi:hypothetical protein